MLKSGYLGVPTLEESRTVLRTQQQHSEGRNNLAEITRLESGGFQSVSYVVDHCAHEHKKREHFGLLETSYILFKFLKLAFPKLILCSLIRSVRSAWE